MSFLVREYDAYSNKPKGIASILEQLNKKFTVVYRDTLFTPSWEALEVNRCPLCGCKLYQLRNKPLFRCKSVKHKSFLIREETLNKVKYELRETKRRKEEWQKKKEMYRSQPPVYRYGG